MSYPLKYRDNSHNKYIIDIEEIEDDSDGKVVLARIKQEENIVARIKLFFDYSWTQKWAKTPEGFRNILFSIDSWSPLIADAIRDFIFGKNLDDLNGREIVFDRSSSRARKVKKHGDGLLYYERSEQI